MGECGLVCGKKDGDMSRIGTVLITCRIERGLGDVNWAVNIGREMERGYGARPTFLFYDAKEDSIAHLGDRSEFSVEYIDDMDKVTGGRESEGKGYVYRRDAGSSRHPGCVVSVEELEELSRRYDLVVAFRCEQEVFQNSRLEGRILFVGEYGTDPNRSLVFFKNYNEMYGGMVESQAGYCRMCVEWGEFVSTLDAEQRERAEMSRVPDLLSFGEYYFTYFARWKKDLGSCVGIVKHFCVQVSKLTQEGQMTVFTNLDIRELARKEYIVRKHEEESMKTGRHTSAQDDEHRSSRLKETYNIVSKKGDPTLYLCVSSGGRVVEARLVYYGKVSAEEFEYLLLRSKGIVGCTGDMSLTQVLSSERIFMYEILEHKKELFNDLMSMWRSVTGGKRPELPHIDVGTAKDDHGYFEYYDGFLEDYHKFIDELKRETFQMWLRRRIEEVVNRLYM